MIYSTTLVLLLPKRHQSTDGVCVCVSVAVKSWPPLIVITLQFTITSRVRVVVVRAGAGWVILIGIVIYCTPSCLVYTTFDFTFLLLLRRPTNCSLLYDTSSRSVFDRVQYTNICLLAHWDATNQKSISIQNFFGSTRLYRLHCPSRVCVVECR